jgi:peroxin-19
VWPQETPEVQSLIDGLMQQLLSKEVLYQPMQDIAAKYPEWLAKQRGVLPEEELTKYEEQYRYIQEVCALYEAEPTDFEKVVEAMQKVRYRLRNLISLSSDFRALLLN